MAEYSGLSASSKRLGQVQVSRRRNERMTSCAIQVTAFNNGGVGGSRLQKSQQSRRYTRSPAHFSVPGKREVEAASPCMNMAIDTIMRQRAAEK